MVRSTTILAAALVAAALTVPAAASAAPRVTISQDCVRQARAPTNIVVACADAGFTLGHLRWRGWGDSRAHATGTASVNRCVPTCVSGTFRSYAGVKVTVSALKRCNGKPQYSRLQYEFTQGTPFPDRKGEVRFTCITAPKAQRVYLPSNCLNQRFQPAQLVITCADANFILRAVRWRRWGGDTAAGRGNAVVNTCEPSCAEGRFRSYPGVRVTASAVRTCANGRRQYTRVRWRFTDRHPKGERSGGVPLPCPS